MLLQTSRTQLSVESCLIAPSYVLSEALFFLTVIRLFLVVACFGLFGGAQ
jgi:hypothetical protein